MTGSTNAIQTGNLFAEAKLDLAKQKVPQITDDLVCKHIVQTHQPSCEHWRSMSTSSLYMYINHCLKHLGMTAFSCTDICIVHKYTERNGGLLPESRANLFHFWNSMKIPTANLEMLQPSFLNVDKDCSICYGQLVHGTQAYQLACGHAFHVTTEQCNLIRWLTQTNSCPRCDGIVKLSSSPRDAKQQINTSAVT